MHHSNPLPAGKSVYSNPKARVLPGKASNYITCMGDLDGVHTCFLVCRVSTKQQDHTGNLGGQTDFLSKVACRASWEVLEVVRHVGSGIDPHWLQEWAQKAKEKGAVLLAESTDRFIRHAHFQSSDSVFSDMQADEQDLQRLKKATRGVILVTVYDPDSPPESIRSSQRKRGQAAKENSGGRPEKKITRRELKEGNIEQVVSWYRGGFSTREISRKLALQKVTVSHKTVWKWLLPFQKG